MDPASVRPSPVGVVRPFTFSNVFSSETAWPIKANFYVEPPWEGGTKAYINGPGHMTKMAGMPIYGKKHLKIFFSRTRSPMILKLGMKHQGLNLYKVYMHYDPGLTLTYFTARLNWIAYMFEWGKLLQSHFMGENLQQRTVLTE